MYISQPQNHSDIYGDILANPVLCLNTNYDINAEKWFVFLFNNEQSKTEDIRELENILAVARLSYTAQHSEILNASGGYVQISVAATSRPVESNVSEKGVSQTEYIEVFADRIRNVMSSLFLNVTDISRILHVSRPTVYSYLNKETKEVGDGVSRKLTYLETQSRRILECKCPFLQNFIKKPLLNSKSILDALVNEEELGPYLDTLSTMSQAMLARRKKIDASLRGVSKKKNELFMSPILTCDD